MGIKCYFLKSFIMENVKHKEKLNYVMPSFKLSTHGPFTSPIPSPLF